MTMLSESEMAVLDAALLPCLLCGSPCDDARNEEGEGYLGCTSALCPAHRFALTDEKWNSRNMAEWLDVASILSEFSKRN